MSPFIVYQHEDLELHLSRMGGAGFGLYAVLQSFTGKTNTCYPTFKQIREITKHDNKWIIRALTWLEETGYVEVVRDSEWGRNQYIVHKMGDVQWDNRLPPIQGGRGGQRQQFDTKTPPEAKRHQDGQNATEAKRHQTPPKRHQPSGITPPRLHVKEEPIKKTLSRSPTARDRFEEFWQAYPARRGKKNLKADARTWWIQHRVSEEMFANIMLGLEAHKQSDEWQEDSGRFVPDAIRFLRKERWKDEFRSTSRSTAVIVNLPNGSVKSEEKTLAPGEGLRLLREGFRGLRHSPV